MKVLFPLLTHILCFASLFAAEATKPHIVLILADDLGRADCGFMGGKDIHTPHLDALAKSGAILDQFYVQPVCSPTRAALITGRYPMRHGLQVGVVRPYAQYGLPLEERTLPQALREVGYATAIVGKWHLGTFQPAYLPLQRGFDHQYGHYNGQIDYFTHERDGGFDWHRDDKASRDEGYSTHLIAKESVRLIREREQDKPLFLYIPFNAVHGPLQVPESYLQPYAHLKGNRRLYAGMLSAMDEAVGQIVAAVDEAGIRDNTLFLFSSDNGGPNPGNTTDNGPLRAGKGTLYEGGTRVAAFAAWKGKIQPATTVHTPLHMVDLFPTLLHLAGASLQQPLPLDGVNVWPCIIAGAARPKDTILINTSPTQGAIRKGDWKLVMGGSAPAEAEAPEAKPKPKKKAKAKKANSPQQIELFNLAADPSETKNLATEQPEIVRELQTDLAALAAEAVPPKSAPIEKGFKVPKVWGETANAPATPKSPSTPPAPPVEVYMGRTVAMTMHWQGASWLIRNKREREEAASQMRKALQLKPGMSVCDMGCGNGYHTLPMAQAIGEEGKVYAVDVQPEMITLLQERAEQKALKNLIPIISDPHDSKLPENSCDLILLVDVYHEFSHPAEMLQSMKKALKPGGQIVLVEFRAEDDTVPIKPEHKMSKAQILKELQASGFSLAREYDELPWQHMMFFKS